MGSVQSSSNTYAREGDSQSARRTHFLSTTTGTTMWFVVVPVFYRKLGTRCSGRAVKLRSARTSVESLFCPASPFQFSLFQQCRSVVLSSSRISLSSVDHPDCSIGGGAFRTEGQSSGGTSFEGL